MAHFNNKNQQQGGGGGPWSRGGNGGGHPGQQQQQPPPTGLEMPPGLMGFGGPHHGPPPGAAGPPVFQQGPPGLPNLGGHHHPQGLMSYPRPMGGANPFGGNPAAAAAAAAAAQQILQQQAAAAAVVGAAMQQHHQQQQQQQQQQQHGPPGPGQPSQRVFTGTVTKLHDSFGFVDEDVFFQTTVVKGETPKVNDRVLVEAGYNPNMPFKWNATRIQVLPNQQQQQGGGGGGGRGGGPSTVNPTATLNNIAFSNQQPSGGGGLGSHTQMNKHMGGGGGGHGHRGGDNVIGFGNRGGDSGRDRDNMVGNGRQGGNQMGGGLAGGGGRQNNSPTMRGGGGRGGVDKQQEPSSANAPRQGGGGGGGGGDRDRRQQRDERSAGSGSRNQDRERSRDKDRSSGGGGGGGRSSPPPSKKRSRSPPARTRSRSRSRSPQRRKPRTGPRYNVSVPKISLNFPESSVMELRKRYSNMYVPSDFFLADHAWMKSFPMHHPCKLQYPATYHIFNKELVEPPSPVDAVYDPPDADYTYSVKVMLAALPPVEELYGKTCLMADAAGANGRDSLVHPTRIIQFLVGVRGKNETMAIGGPWSPSLDGPDPEKDPSVLVRTAIRTCKAFAGIDLSGCTQWHRFVEIHYRRQETSSKPARTETTVIFLPDVWSITPTAAEFAELEGLYSEALNVRLNPPEPPKVEKKEPPAVNKKANAESMDESSEEKSAEKAEEDASQEDKGSEEAAEEDKEEQDDSDSSSSRRKPTPWAELDIKSMKVNDLRDELQARGLNSKGLKSQLLGRLQKDIKEEQEREEAAESKQSGEEKAPEEGDVVDAPVKKEEEQKDADDEPEVMEIVDDDSLFAKPKPIDEKQKLALANAYKMPASACILVHPNPKAKGGKFDCVTMSLSVLLDYRLDDNKEGTFEVSLFAELFNEMLMRDSGFKIFRALHDSLLLSSSSAEKKEEKKGDSNKKEDAAANDSAGDDKKSDTDSTTGASSSTVTPDEGGGGGGSKKKPKLVTVKKDLLMACSYFDLGHAGYFETKDLEDILSTVNINLSRAQIKKLISKVATKDQVTYRTFTDKPALEAATTTDALPEEEAAEEEEDPDQLEQLGLGFRAFVPKEVASSSVSTTTSTTQPQQDGVCSYRGSVVDVKKLVYQLDRSEKSRIDTESRLSETSKALGELKEASEKHNSVRDKLQTEVRDLKKRLRAAEDDFKRSQLDTSRYLTGLKDVHARVGPLVAVVAPPPPPVKISPLPPLSTAEGLPIAKKEEEGEEEVSAVNGQSSSVVKGEEAGLD